jgi:hypothetical protein
MKIFGIIKEEVINFLKEYEGEEVDWDLYEKQNDIKFQILHDFLYRNNPELTKRIPWRVVPAARLKKIWEDFIRHGVVRDEKGLDMIESIMISNALKLQVMTELAGHTSSDPDYDFEEAWGYYVDDYIGRVMPQPYADVDQTEIPFEDPTQPHKRKPYREPFEPNSNFDNIRNIPFQNYVEEHENDLNPQTIKKDLMEILTEHFYEYYSVDSQGHNILSDYGTDPLVNLAFELAKENNAEKKVVIIDKMLNIVHQRSDLATWFVEGGSRALSNISGYYSDSDYSWNAKSVVSGT